MGLKWLSTLWQALQHAKEGMDAAQVALDLTKAFSEIRADPPVRLPSWQELADSITRTDYVTGGDPLTVDAPDPLTVAAGGEVTGSQLVGRVSGGNGTYTEVVFADATPGTDGGRLYHNGQPVSFVVVPWSELDTVVYRAGARTGSDEIAIEVRDSAGAVGEDLVQLVVGGGNHAPVVEATATDPDGGLVHHVGREPDHACLDQLLGLQWSDADGDAITRVGLWDAVFGAGHIEVDGQPIPRQGQIVDVSTLTAGRVEYLFGTGSGENRIGITVFYENGAESTIELVTIRNRVDGQGSSPPVPDAGFWAQWVDRLPLLVKTMYYAYDQGDLSTLVPQVFGGDFRVLTPKDLGLPAEGQVDFADGTNVFWSFDRNRYYNGGFGREDLNSDAFALYNTQETELLVGIRGTKSVRDWLDNFDMALSSPLVASQVHYQKLRPFFDAVLALAERTGSDVLVAGHSLGGAMVEAFWYRAAELGFDLTRIHALTVASPWLPGNVNLPSAAQLNTVSVFHSDDIVADILRGYNNERVGQVLEIEQNVQGIREIIDAHDSGVYLQELLATVADPDVVATVSIGGRIISYYDPDAPTAARRIELPGGTVPVLGGGGSDEIVGTMGDDHAIGGAGDDALSGRAGDDRFIGGTRRDVLDGGTGDDILAGGAGRDTLHGGPGNDVLHGGTGDDLLEGGSGSDTLRWDGRRRLPAPAR